MISIITIGKRLICALLTVAFTGAFGVFGLNGKLNTPSYSVPSDFEPVIRFVVTSDAHIDNDGNSDNEIKLANAFTDIYEYSQSRNYSALDAFVIAGDMTGRGRDDQYVKLNSIINENIAEETRLITCLGNHEFIEYRSYDASIGYEKYLEYMDSEINTHVVINGYHFIAVSYDDNGKTLKGQYDWLKEQLDAAVADTGDKPIFVFQHPHPFATVYGSINWSSDINFVLASYPQVVDFSGHSHYPASDPRSVWQGSFTAINTGSITNATGNPDYISETEADAGNNGTAWLVEADKDGNIRLALYDVANRCFYNDVDLYLPLVSKASNRIYTWANRKSIDTAPVFTSGNNSVCYNDDNTTTISFPEAKGYYRTVCYHIDVTSAKGNVYSGTYYGDDSCAITDGICTVNIGETDSGTEYNVRVEGISPYGKASTSAYRFSFVAEK